MKNEIIKLIFQLIILGIVGGGVTFYFNKLQKNKEIIISVLNQLSSIHTDFLSLRYKFNVFFTEAGKPIQSILSPEEIDKLKWKYYEESCFLLSKFQSLKPLLIKYVPELKEQIALMDGHYQNYRRTIRKNQPIFQNETGKTESALNKLKDLHRDLVNELMSKI